MWPASATLQPACPAIMSLGSWRTALTTSLRLLGVRESLQPTLPAACLLLNRAAPMLLQIAGSVLDYTFTNDKVTFVGDAIELSEGKSRLA